ncbi:MAG: enoyl-CoA hydratase/isomerase family protein [Bradyrhizobium sp.]
MANVVIETADDCTLLRLSNTNANLLTIDVVRELAIAMRAASRSSRAILLCGGEKFFSNGLDLSWALTRSADEMRAMFLSLGELVMQMLAAPVPIIGAIKGHAVGAGKTLFCACDVRFAASGRVLIGVPEILLGVPNPYFADQLLRHIAGDAVASELINTGRLIASEEAQRYGIVTHLAEKTVVEDEAWKRAHAMAALSQAAFAETKSMRVEALTDTIRRNLDARTERLIAIWIKPETQQRLKAAAERVSK